ncbi:MAG TPA: hypothetical protein VIU61_25795 [Kofleriaceae bacterium]
MKRLVLLLLLAAAACGKGPSNDQCKKLLDHLVDLEFKKAGATATADSQKTDLAKQKQAVVENKSKDFIAACVDKTAKDRVECALQATDLEAVGKCDDPK